MRKSFKCIFFVVMFVCLNIGVINLTANAAGSKLATPQISVSNVQSSGKIKIKWEPVENAISYKVYRSLDGENWSRLITTKKTSVVNTSAVAGKTYYYKVKAIASTSSCDSQYSVVKKRMCDLARPTISLSTKTESGKTIISWKKVDKAVSYKVYCSRNKESWNLVKTTDNTSVTHTGATAGKKYYYKVRAIAAKSSANSAYSSVKYRTCKAPYQLSDYQEDVVSLGKKIATEWKTTYTQGKTGQKNSSGAYQFDCSGFTTYVINKVMVKKIPTFRLTSNISKLCALDVVYNEGYPGEFAVKTVSWNDIQPGDVIFFSHNSSNDHCGIYIGNNRFVHCTKSNGGVAINNIVGYYKEDLSVVRRYIPTKVTAANTKKTISATYGCKLYSERANDDSAIATLKKGSTVTVLFTGNNPESYNQAYVKTSDGTKGFVYAKNLK